jgi:iron-sulfur cluster repair protein YtfE (RIC family)
MSDELAIINRIIEWHQTLRGHVKLVGEAIPDREALSNLQRVRADWVPGRPDILAEKQKKLEQTISFLDEGLRNHFAYEEKVLPPILGELFMRALVLDHQEVREEIDGAKSTVLGTELEGLSREELLAKESEIQQVIESMCQTFEDHATREEVILGMLQRALQDIQQSKGQT